MNPPSNSNITNPFGPDTSSGIPVTNPSPFKLFKSQASTTSTPQNLPQSFPTTVPPVSFSTPFPSKPTPAPIHSFSAQPAHATGPKPAPSGSIKELEAKSNSMLSKRRIQDIIDEWKANINKHVSCFRELNEEVGVCERPLSEVQKEIILSQGTFYKIKAGQKKINESLELMENELSESVSALDIIDKELDKVAQGNGMGGIEEKENIYGMARVISRGIDCAENQLLNVIHRINDKYEDVEGDQDVERTLDIFCESLDWIEKTAEGIKERLGNIEKRC